MPISSAQWKEQRNNDTIGHQSRYGQLQAPASRSVLELLYDHRLAVAYHAVEQLDQQQLAHLQEYQQQASKMVRSEVDLMLFIY